MSKLALLFLAAAPPIINVGPAADGSTIHLKPRADLVIHLQANPSTGYAWKLVQNGAPVLRVRARTYVRSKAKHRVGAAGTYFVRFRAVKKGRTIVSLAYVRHTAPASPPARTYRLTVDVP